MQMRTVVFCAIAMVLSVAGSCFGAGITAKPVRVLYLGDSLSDFDRGSNQVDRLQAKLDAACPRMVSIYNYSIRGDYIDRLLDRIAEKKGTYALERFNGIWGRQYDWAFVFLGHNDTRATSEKDFSEPFIPLDTVAPRFEKLVGILREKGISRIIFVSPSSSNFEKCSSNAEKRLAAIKAGKGGKSKTVSRFGDPKHMEAFADALRGVAAATGCEYFDVYTEMKALPDKASYLNPNDGVHLSAKGHEYIAQRTFEYLQSHGQSCCK